MGEPSILVVAFNKQLFGLNRHTGARLWTRTLESFGAIRIAVSVERVVVLNDKLFCFDSATGELCWTVKPPMSGAETLLVEGGHIFVGGGGEVACFSEEGSLLWHDPFRGCGADRVALGVTGQASQVDLHRA